MNEQTIEYRLDQIDKKLDSLTDLLVQTQKQEIRLQNVENAIIELKKNQNAKVERWLNPLISATVSGLVAYLFVKIGVK